KKSKADHKEHREKAEVTENMLKGEKMRPSSTQYSSQEKKNFTDSNTAWLKPQPTHLNRRGRRGKPNSQDSEESRGQREGQYNRTAINTKKSCQNNKILN